MHNSKNIKQSLQRLQAKRLTIRSYKHRGRASSHYILLHIFFLELRSVDLIIPSPLERIHPQSKIWRKKGGRFGSETRKKTVLHPSLIALFGSFFQST